MSVIRELKRIRIFGINLRVNYVIAHSPPILLYQTHPPPIPSRHGPPNKLSPSRRLPTPPHKTMAGFSPSHKTDAHVSNFHHRLSFRLRTHRLSARSASLGRRSSKRLPRPTHRKGSQIRHLIRCPNPSSKGISYSSSLPLFSHTLGPYRLLRGRSRRPRHTSHPEN